MSASVAQATWLHAEHLQALLKALGSDGEEARVVGGAIRNTLLGLDAKDIDIATTRRPEDASAVANALDYKVVPTGIEHGTITIITPEGPYEVTTLREDVETDGRHAKVEFGRNWRADAERRDFTVNALYAEPDGRIIDLVGGLADIGERRIRFIGDSDQRIEEDGLRILRFFRFYAHYGAGRPDANGLRACVRHKGSLLRLSAERVWSELRRLLEAKDPRRALLWMRQTSVLTTVLPESEKWGIDTVATLIETERTLNIAPDPMLRLAAIVPPTLERLGPMMDRLRLSNTERDRLNGWVGTQTTDTDGPSLRELAYRQGQQAVLDNLALRHANAQAADMTNDATNIARAYAALRKWEIPILPIKGGNLVALGVGKGPAVGALQRDLEDRWIASDFTLTRNELLSTAEELIASQSAPEAGF